MRTSFFPILLAICLSGSANAWAFDPCHDAPSAYRPLAARYTKGLLFKVEACGHPPSYVFGTLHMDDPEVDKAAAQAFAVLAQVKEAGFEIVGDAAALRAKAQASMFVPAGSDQRLSNLLGMMQFARLLRLLGADKASVPALERTQPWVVAIMLEVKDVVTEGLVLDEKLKKQAQQDGKILFGLETPEEQFHVFTESPLEYQVILLKDTMAELGDAKRIRDAMREAYIAHDGLKTMALDKQMLLLSRHREVDEYYNKRLLPDRNKVMETRMTPHLQKTSNLIAVGMLHLLGKGGIIELLEHDGYYVTAIP